ncbi:MAG: NAD+ synthase [Candidatus Omnitrophica bacterium]|nr:NAD+ synthase [Candidatus Omnitrophota bacterium]
MIMIRIALAQINPIVGDLKGNSLRIKDEIAKAAALCADLVVFPELALCGYPPEDLLYKEHFIKDNLHAVNELAKEAKIIAAIFGFVDMDKKGNLYNAAAIIHNGKVVGVYHKRQLPNYGVFDEKRYFISGNNEGLFSLNGVSIGVSICEDIWIDRGVVEEQVRNGAKVIINISSSPYDVGKLSQREKLLKEKAKKLKAPVCYANLVGGQDELVFDGGSVVYGSKADVLAYGKQFEEDLIQADLNISPSHRKKKMKIELKTSAAPKKTIKEIKAVRYTSIERIYKALVLGTRDYIQKNGFEKVLIGLSGGIDSAVVAAVAAEAVGANNVIGVTMPSQYTSDGTKSDAFGVAGNLGIEILEIPIRDIFESYTEGLKDTFQGTKPGLAEENIQARIRGNILMAISNKYGWLVLTTGNKSEFAVGYCTLYGDMSGGFAVIKDVPKTKVYELARFINRQREIVPSSTIERAPSAELRENQKDQDSLPPYDLLDKLLAGYIEEHKSITRNVKGKNKDIAKEVVRLVDRSEYKRRQSPPGVKISPRAFGKDWRLPITNKYSDL